MGKRYVKIERIPERIRSYFLLGIYVFRVNIYITIAYRGARGDADDLDSKKQKTAEIIAADKDLPD